MTAARPARCSAATWKRWPTARRRSRWRWHQGTDYFGQRIRQFITIQKMALGDIKGALQISQFMITDANRPGQKGYLFNAQRIAAHVLVQMGDIPQAEGYMRRSHALLQEARTSGLPGWRTNYNIKGRSWEGEVEAIRAVDL